MGIHRVQFCLDAFQSPGDRTRSEENLKDLLSTLCRINARYLRDVPDTPLLYHSGVRYEGEPYGQENWQDIPTTHRLGYGDCEDLACWRVAELRAHGCPAEPTFLWRTIRIHNPDTGALETPVLYHILVRLPTGALECPSKRLGMGKGPTPLARLAA